MFMVKLKKPKRSTAKKKTTKTPAKKKPASRAIVKKPDAPLPVSDKVTEQTIQDYLFGSGTVLDEQQKKLFIQTAVSMNLNPFKREIHAVPYEEKFKQNGRWVSHDPKKYRLSIVVGYEVYLKRADQSGKLAGWKVWTEGQGNQLKAVIEIKRHDFQDVFRHEVYADEYAQQYGLWTTKRRTMIKKVAISQGFRMAFPSELSGIPYTSDEYDPAAEAEYKTVNAEVREPKALPVDIGPATTDAPQGNGKEDKYTLPEGITPDTVCNVGANAGKCKYGELSIDALRVLHDKATNPVELEGVLNFVISERITEICEKINYTPEDLQGVIDLKFKGKQLIDLSWTARLMVLQNLKKIENKKAEGGK